MDLKHKHETFEFSSEGNIEILVHQAASSQISHDLTLVYPENEPGDTGACSSPREGERDWTQAQLPIT